MFLCQYVCSKVLTCDEFLCKWPLHGLIVCVSLLEHIMTCCVRMLIYACIIY